MKALLWINPKSRLAAIFELKLEIDCKINYI